MAELLFLPPRQQVQKTKKTGSRVSRRLLKQQQEKEAAREFAGTQQKGWPRPFQAYLICHSLHRRKVPPKEDASGSAEVNNALGPRWASPETS